MSARMRTTAADRDAGSRLVEIRPDLTPRANGTVSPVIASAVRSVVDELQQRILDGSLAVGTLLPPERELATHLQVSRATLRQSLSILAQRELVTSRRGRNGGVIVTAPSMTTVASTMTLLCRTGVLTAAQLTEVRRGANCAPRTTASSPTTTTNRIWRTSGGRTGSGVRRRCWGGCMGCGATRLNWIGSSGSVQSASSIATATCASGDGECTASGVWRGDGAQFGCPARC